MKKVRWTKAERLKVISHINTDINDPTRVPDGLVVDFTDVYMDHVQGSCLPPRRWIDWKDNVSINPDIAACFGKTYAVKVKVTKLPSPKLAVDLDREIGEGRRRAVIEVSVSKMLLAAYELADEARLGGSIKTSDIELIEHSIRRLIDSPSEIQPETSKPEESSSDGEFIVDMDEGPNKTTLELREISRKKSKFVIIGALSKHQSQIDTSLRGNDQFEIVWQPRCRNWRDSVSGASAVMMSTLCDGQSVSACRQHCKAHSIPFEPSGTGKTAIIGWIMRHTIGVRIDGTWHEPDGFKLTK